ncbi:S-adenosylmethionine:tRNA ribosyltransferase-isomerase [hydrothermal vent metagenome]|uniref:S-adenosylmethionine:tRNA ribosyltransferase-isomerase n=1 Tax=hydrothermal vent metagenome TaxID=652676 RepID=A0A3B0U833_9ZZZZ
MLVDEFDFNLPQELIALHPVSPRDSARMLFVDKNGALDDRIVTDLAKILRPNDVLVVNDTKVIPAELNGTRVRGEFRSSVSFNLHKRINQQSWLAFARPAKRLKVGDRVVFGQKLTNHQNIEPDRACAAQNLVASVTEIMDGGQVRLDFDLTGPYLDEAIKSHGAMPLPPYIGSKRAIEPRDEQDYQTMFAKFDGAVAAPTAGLHFTSQLEKNLADLGVTIEKLTLHVGAGTFLPVKVDDTKDHKMHAEWGEVSDESVQRIREAKQKGGRVIAVGTTSLRLLESASVKTGDLQAFSGDTDIFITPGFEFKTVDLLLTNFHLPRSTLFMLVSAFSGAKIMHSAYKHAIDNKYRFYSYGDASLLSRQKHDD